MIGIGTENMIKKGSITDQEREIMKCNNIAVTATEKGEAKVGAGKGEKGKARSTLYENNKCSGLVDQWLE